MIKQLKLELLIYTLLVSFLVRSAGILFLLADISETLNLGAKLYHNFY